MGASLVSISIKAVDRIDHALGQRADDKGGGVFVTRFAASDAPTPDPVVVKANNAEEAGEKALAAVAGGYPQPKAGDDPLLYCTHAQDTLATLLTLETARWGGRASAQSRRLRRAQAILARLLKLDDAFAGPALTRRGKASVLRGQTSQLDYSATRAAIEDLDFAFTENGRRAALLVEGAPFQPIELIGLSLEFAALLREAQILEADRVGHDIGLGEIAARTEASKAIVADPAPTPAIETSAALWVNTKEASRRLGVSPSYLAQLRVRGSGPPFSHLGKAVRYCIKDLCDWAEARRQSSTSDANNGR